MRGRSYEISMLIFEYESMATCVWTAEASRKSIWMLLFALTSIPKKLLFIYFFPSASFHVCLLMLCYSNDFRFSCTEKEIRSENVWETAYNAQWNTKSTEKEKEIKRNMRQREKDEIKHQNNDFSTCRAVLFYHLQSRSYSASFTQWFRFSSPVMLYGWCDNIFSIKVKFSINFSFSLMNIF